MVGSDRGWGQEPSPAATDRRNSVRTPFKEAECRIILCLTEDKAHSPPYVPAEASAWLYQQKCSGRLIKLEAQ